MPVIYKIIAKAIALRLAPLLDKIITPHQHGFIKGKFIFDNILAAMIGMKYASFSKKKFIALQLDLDKAYERGSWLFVENTMRALGFGECMATAISSLSRGMSEVSFKTKITRSF